MSAQWPAEEEKWGFWSRLIHHYCGEYKETKVMSDLKAVIGGKDGEYKETKVMSDLKAVIGGKDYFVITSNGECHFEMCGFDPEKICEIEGNWLTMQCAAGCHQKLYPVLELAEKMAAKEQSGKIPSELVPRCAAVL